MLAPHAVDIAVIITSLIASLCFTFAEPSFDIFLFVKFCIGQRKYKPKCDRSIRARSLNPFISHSVNKNSRKNDTSANSVSPINLSVTYHF